MSSGSHLSPEEALASGATAWHLWCQTSSQGRTRIDEVRVSTSTTVDLHSYEFQRVDFGLIVIDGTNASGNTYRDCTIDRFEMIHSNLSKTRLYNCSIRQFILSESALHKVDFGSTTSIEAIAMENSVLSLVRAEGLAIEDLSSTGTLWMKDCKINVQFQSPPRLEIVLADRCELKLEVNNQVCHAVRVDLNSATVRKTRLKPEVQALRLAESVMEDSDLDVSMVGHTEFAKSTVYRCAIRGAHLDVTDLGDTTFVSSALLDVVTPTPPKQPVFGRRPTPSWLFSHPIKDIASVDDRIRQTISVLQSERRINKIIARGGPVSWITATWAVVSGYGRNYVRLLAFTIGSTILFGLLLMLPQYEVTGTGACPKEIKQAVCSAVEVRHLTPIEIPLEAASLAVSGSMLRGKAVTLEGSVVNATLQLVGLINLGLLVATVTFGLLRLHES